MSTQELTANDLDQRLDARPIRSCEPDTPWDRTLELRDKIADQVRATLVEEDVDALTIVSANGVFPPWVRLEAWLPSAGQGRARERNRLDFTIDARAYRRSPLVVSASLVKGRKTISVKNRTTFDVGMVSEWVRHAIGRGKKPSNHHPWKDWFISLLAGVMPFVKRPDHNPIERQYRSGWLSGAGVLAWGSVLLIVFGGSVFPGLPLAGFIGLAFAIVTIRRRKRLVHLAPIPEESPRDTFVVDSWHAVIADVGHDFEGIKDRLSNCVTRDLESMDITGNHELYSYETATGYEERERLVVSKRQSLVHVHVYPFAEDIFVGWDALLNWMTWGESNPVSVKRQNGHEIQFRESRPKFSVPNELDLVDLNSLSDFVHRRLQHELKAILKERSIDQQIDFHVIRGDRDVALDSKKHGGKGKKTSGFGWRHGS